MAEVEVGGMKFSGGKFFIAISIISTLAGSLWAGFEFYADYMDMKEIVQEIDIDEIKAENELVLTKLEDAIVYTRDIKNNLRDDLLKLEGYIDRMDGKIDTSNENIKKTQGSIDAVLEDVLNEMNQVQKDVTASIREVESLIRESEKDVRDTMRETETRIETDLDALETKLYEQIQEALDNPLSN
jgi:flagellar hook-basal body complex protein FliE|tara:strand:+ start:2667 stop:3221 length:555 start_codon:yes stop_codon:yes gene_type:complete